MRASGSGAASEDGSSELLLDSPLTPNADLPLPLDLPPAMFSGPGLLALADLLPVMTAADGLDGPSREPGP